MEEFLIALLCLAVIALAIKLNRLDSARDRFGELFDLVRRLEQRIVTLEGSLARIAARQPSTEPEPIPRTATPPTVATAPVIYQEQQFIVPAVIKQPTPEQSAPPPPPIPSRPIVTPQPPQQPEPVSRSISLEERLGQNWLSKIGIVLVVLGVASFLGYKLVTLGPLGKSLTGLVTALILLVGGLFLERKPGYRIFARAGIGGGWALLFFVSFALYHVDAMRVLTSQAADLVLMFAVATAMVWHSLRYKSQVVTALAFLLAFATVGISDVTLFSLVAGALLSAALVYVAAREYWFELGLSGLCGVYFNHFLWLNRVLPNGGQPGLTLPDFFPSAGLLFLYWLIFRLFYILRIPLNRRQELIASATAILNSVGLLALLKYQSSHPEWAFYALLVLGVIELLLAFVARTRWRTAFIVLSTLASALLLAAIPFHYDGSNWTLLWLFESEAIFIAGVRLNERTFRRLGLIAGFLAGLQAVAIDSFPVVLARITHDDLTRHPAVFIALLTTALVFWFNSEVAPRIWSSLLESTSDEFDQAALKITTFFALLSLALALYIFFPASWTIVAWLVAALVLTFVSDKLSSATLASQADLLAVVSVFRGFLVNLPASSDSTAILFAHVTTRAATVSIAAILLYACMFRKTHALRFLEREYIPAAYSWAASALLASLCWYELQPAAIAIAWGILGLLLFELGTFFRRDYLRRQAYALFAISFLRIFYFDLDLGSAVHQSAPHIYTIVPLIAAYIWVYHRCQTALRNSSSDRIAGLIAAWLGTTAATTLLYLELRPELIALGWSVLALVLITTAWLLRRSIFTAQALALLFSAAARTLFFNIFSLVSPTPTLWTSRAFTVSIACAAMLLSLPMAFAIRRYRLSLNPDSATETAVFPQSAPASGDLHFLLTHPEQPFFFVPYALLAILIAFELHSGMITLGWIALGLTAFLAALPIGERSYRLSGLALLLLGLGKIVVIDIWSASITDRILTLIITGVALLLVSFLYSRFRETILKFL